MVSESVEFKAGIQAVPGSSYSRIANGGLKLIYSELAGFYNSTGEGSLYIGISDSTRKPTALEDQLSLLFPSLYSRDRVESTLFYNIARTWTHNQTNFLQSLSYHWFVLNSHLILRIDVKKTIIAYEPVWAIGTGKTATAEQAEEVCAFIRATLAKLYGQETADAVTIQYGGSMNEKNCDELVAKENVDGGLIGGASLVAEKFAAIVKAASK